MIRLQWNETALEFLHEDIPGSENMVPVFSIHNGENDWKQMIALFSSVTKQFYWISSAGCSCCDDLFSHVKTTDDLTSGNERDLKREVRAFTEANPKILTDEEKEKIFSKIKKQK